MDKSVEAKAGLLERDEHGKLSSVSVVLSQEIDRFNKLTLQMRSTLTDLQKAIRGAVVMSSDLDLAFHSLLNNQVECSESRLHVCRAP
jgi:dynein heavy chain, axonemal